MDGKELNAFLELILPPLRQHIADELERQLDGRMKTALEKNLVEMNDKLGHIVRLVGKINEK